VRMAQEHSIPLYLHRNIYNDTAVRLKFMCKPEPIHAEHCMI
jgi:hypothetical protein